MPSEVSVTVDTRDFPGHPTSGVVLRGVGARYDDRTRGDNTFNRYEGEAAGFIPIAGSRIVLALHGWVMRSDAEDGRRAVLPAAQPGRRQLPAVLDRLPVPRRQHGCSPTPRCEWR